MDRLNIFFFPTNILVFINLKSIKYREKTSGDPNNDFVLGDKKNQTFLCLKDFVLQGLKPKTVIFARTIEILKALCPNNEKTRAWFFYVLTDTKKD